MKKTAIIVALILAFTCLVFSACGEPPVDYGELTIEDITVLDTGEAAISPVFSIEDKAEEITYRFEGNAISIENGVVKGLIGGTETTVTAKTAHHETTFIVTVNTDYGTLEINDVNLMFMQEKLISPVFSIEAYEEEITYLFYGNAISVTDGMIKGLIPETETTVIAKTAHHETEFKVKVDYGSATLTNTTGAEAKYVIPTPIAIRFIVYADIEVEQYRENGYTRICSFAFNASRGSWYNIEINEAGNVILYGDFNGVHKYGIYLFNIADESVNTDGKTLFHVIILRNGQATKLFINDKLVCSYSEEEMQGYAELAGLEVTAAADREYANAGEYKINVSKVYYEGADSAAYARYDAVSELNYADGKLESADGNESKFSYGSPSFAFTDFVLTTKITVNSEITCWTRTSAFAFNVSDNSWYNIETDESGNYTLYGRFNGVEKYGIHLFNKTDEGIIVDGKVVYNVALMKKGQATWFFVNDKLVCSFTEAEMSGYNVLGSLEASAMANRTPTAYDISITENKISDSTTVAFAKYDALIA